MNTAPKLQSRLISAAAQWDEYAAASLTSSNATLWRNSAQLLRDAAEALAPPSGEGIGLTVADAWFESPTEITIHAKASCGAKLPEEGTKIYTTPQSAPVDGPKLHFATRKLVDAFSIALAEKLAAAEAKYGYSDGWRDPNWMDECRTKLLEHVAKGDPRDVAAYCAFLWHHGESTTPPPASQERLVDGRYEIEKAASPPSSVAEAKEPEQRCPYCAGRIYSAVGCQNCKVGSVWPKPIAAEQDSSAAVGCNHQWVPDTEVEGVSYCAWCRVTRGDAAEQAKPDDEMNHPCLVTKEGAEACPWYKQYMSLKRWAEGVMNDGRLLPVAEQAQAGELHQSAEQLAQWLEAKYRRHGEDEDRQAAALLRRLTGGVTVDDAMVSAENFSRKTLYDQRESVYKAAERAGPKLYVALKNLLEAVEERPDDMGIESITLADARAALVAALGARNG